MKISFYNARVCCYLLLLIALLIISGLSVITNMKRTLPKNGASSGKVYKQFYLDVTKAIVGLIKVE